MPACACLPDPASRGLSTARMHRSAGHRVCGSTVGGNGPSLKRAQASPECRRGAYCSHKRGRLAHLEIKTHKQKNNTRTFQKEDNLRDLQDHRPLVEGRGIGGPTLADGYSARPLQSHTLVTLPCAGASRVFEMVPADRCLRCASAARTGRPAHACKAGGGTGGQRWRVGAQIFVAPPSTGGRGSLIT